MSEHDPIDFSKITTAVLEEAAKQAVMRVLARHGGYGIDEGVKEIIKECAREIAKEPEIRRKIREQMLWWIGNKHD